MKVRISGEWNPYLFWYKKSFPVRKKSEYCKLRFLDCLLIMELGEEEGS